MPTSGLSAKGLAATARARLSYTFLKRHQGARAEARAGAPVGTKEVYSEPSTHLKTLEGCSTHHTVVLT